MEKLTVSEVLSAVNGALVAGNLDDTFSGVSTDTRTVKEGDIFLALVGENFDGHAFLDKAFEAGASGVIVSKDAPARPVTIRVSDTLVALGDLAGYYASKFETPRIGITGSVGKTSTKEMIWAVLSRRYNTLKNELNFNNEIGVPMTLFKLTREHNLAVIEMAMRLPGEIARLAEIACPQVGVITNIGTSHIERLGSIEAIAAAKAELLEALPRNGTAILPADDKFFDFLLDSCECEAVSFGLSEHADVHGTNVEIDAEGRASFDITLPEEEPFRVKFSVVGVHNVPNGLAAAAVGWHFGVSTEDIKAALEEFAPPEKRANVVRSPKGYTVLDDTYNANPSSMGSAISTLSKVEGKRKVAILGDMLELGDYGPQAHREIGQKAVEAGVSLLITVGELGKSIAGGAIEAGISSVDSVETSDQAAELAAAKVQAGDVVLVKGSRGMRMEKVVGSLVS